MKVSPKVTSRPLPTSEVHAYRAILLPHGGEERAAVLRAEVDEALAEDPTDPLAIAVLAGLDPKLDVLPMARASAKAHPGDWRAWSALGDALEKGPRDEFLAARRKAVEVGPAEPVALRELARDLAAAGEAKEAAAPALALLKLAPWSPATHETVAQVAMSLGLCADALRAQQRAIDTLSDRATPEGRIEKEKVLAGYAAALRGAGRGPPRCAPPRLLRRPRLPRGDVRESPMAPVHAHEAVLELDAGADAAAPGAAITVELCGHWQHEGPCRWPHRTSVTSLAGRVLSARVLFAASPSELPEVRSRIAAGLNRGELTGPDGRVHRWRVCREGPSDPLECEGSLVRELSRLRRREVARSP